MAYIKIIPIKEGKHLDTVFDYIKNPEKTDNGFLISSFMCSAKYAMNDFKAVSELASKRGNNAAHHIIISFAPEDKLMPEKAMQIGKELMKRMYPDYQYVLAVHKDREHIHTHILCNAVDFVKHKKLHSNKYTLKEMRNKSDDICRENGLSVITQEFRSHRYKLRKVIDTEIEKSNSFEDFLNRMQLNGYEIKMQKYLSFKGIYDERFMRTDTLGKAYTEKSIRKRIDGTEVKNEHKTVYISKSIKMSNKKRLKLIIDDVLKETASYDEFMNILRSKGCEIREGKKLSIRLPSANKNIRVESLGEEYSEEMLKLYFSDQQKYNSLVGEIKAGKIEKLSSEDKEYNRYAAAKDVNIEIKMLNLLNKEGISSYDELMALIEKHQKQVDINNKNISFLNSRISEKKEVINAIRTYWRLKPLYQQYKEISNITDKELFRIRNSSDIRKYEVAVEIMNKSKLSDGSLPKAQNLNAEIARIEAQKNDIVIRQEKEKIKLQSYLCIKSNIDKILSNTEKISLSIPEQQYDKQQNIDVQYR